MTTVLVVDDEDRVRAFLNRALSKHGYEVIEAADGESGLRCLDNTQVDLILLDLVMPGIDGMKVLRLLEDRTEAPVIVLSAVADIAVRVAALENGAVDFLVKPFHFSELLARARLHLDGGHSVPPSPRVLEAGSVRLDLERRRVRLDDREVLLAQREFMLLTYLMYRAGHVCHKDELLHDVWDLRFDPGSNVVEVAVRRLRNKVPGLPLETIRGVGYCLAAEAS
ncbi:response regulator transcription factor [Nocardioides sp.]|uniref:response regulator transcription factor n=1 Tax=Nocardioides sp. TaxID=35761 RepID=UPI00356B5480